MRYQVRILQPGTLPLRPDGRCDSVEHRCTSALIWPASEAPTPANTLFTDPCFTRAGFAQARRVAAEVGLELSSLRHLFLTHSHFDHMLNFPAGVERPAVEWFRCVSEALPSLHVVATPGHSDDSRSLVFRDERDRLVHVAGDAVLDREWLLAWGYYWPNGYLREEIMQTWHSVAAVLEADVIIPGHGEPIEVTAELCQRLGEAFALAEYAPECDAVRDAIQARTKALRRE